MRGVLKIALASAVLGFAGAIATPASAAVLVVGPPAGEAGVDACTAFAFSGATEVACAGGYNGPPPGPGGGNLLSGTTVSAPGLAAIQALNPGYAGTGTYLGSVSISGAVLTFSTVLSGLTVIGIHYGSAGAGIEATSFFSFIAPPGTTQITVTGRTGTSSPFGLSNVQLFSTGGPVPEPATWAMMLLGFGGIGMALRRSRKANGRLLQIA